MNRDVSASGGIKAVVRSGTPRLGRRRFGMWVLPGVLVCILSAGAADATHVAMSSGAGQAGPITTTPAGVLAQGRWALEFNVEYLRFDTFSEERLLDFAAEDEEIHNVDSLRQYSVGVAYGLREGIAVHLRVPYIRKSDIVESEPPDEVHVHGDAEGIGDAAIHVHQRVFVSKERNLGMSLTYGVKLPTGKTNDEDDHGERFEAEFQPGSGSWDFLGGAECTVSFGRISLDGNILYTVITEGAQDTDLGDMFNYNLAVSSRFTFPRWTADAVLELNGLWKDKEEQDGKKDPDSGGNILYLSPGLRVGFGESFGFFASWGIPIIQDLNGSQNDVDYRVLFGVGWRI